MTSPLTDIKCAAILERKMFSRKGDIQVFKKR
jgi:hypothetical protein